MSNIDRSELGLLSLARDLRNMNNKQQQQQVRRGKATLQEVIVVIALAFVCIAIGIIFLKIGGLL